MITFDYVCEECGLRFTFLQKDHRKRYNPKKCPECGVETPPTRLINSVRTKSFYGPQHPRHRRGLTHATPAPILPTYSKEDL